MPLNTVLDEATLPDTFEYVVRGSMTLPLARLELHDYRFRRPQQALFRSQDSFLDLAFSHRPGQALGRYVDVPGHTSRPMGDMIFIPAGKRLSSRWGAGMQSSICCRFGGADGGAREWSEAELDASLDIRSSVIRETLLRLAREIQAPGFCGDMLAEALFIQLEIELGRYFRERRATSGHACSHLSPAQMRLIEERLEAPGKPPTIAALAAECGLSTRHFFRVFRATAGTTVSEFATTRRIARAKALLSGNTRRVKEIAYCCGFDTPAAFSAAFRRSTGVTPLQYRRERAC